MILGKERERERERERGGGDNAGEIDLAKHNLLGALLIPFQATLVSIGQEISANSYFKPEPTLLYIKFWISGFLYFAIQVNSVLVTSSKVNIIAIYNSIASSLI